MARLTFMEVATKTFFPEARLCIYRTVIEVSLDDSCMACEVIVLRRHIA